MDKIEHQIVDTLRFFDLQSVPLTAFELHAYLIAPLGQLNPLMDGQYELQNFQEQIENYSFQEIWSTADKMAEEGLIKNFHGYYFLPDREPGFVWQRLRSYGNGLERERKIRRWLIPAKHIPFIRGVALAGSQAFGLQRPDSDIDLLIITDPGYMWLGRTFLTAYFQILGVRRHGNKIANRFCLNHYLGRARLVDAERNLYKAMEYAKLRPILYSQTIAKFQSANSKWIKTFFPNFEVTSGLADGQSGIQSLLEKLFTNRLGKWLEEKLKHWQLKRIKQDKFIFVREDELSFHPASKHEQLLQGFFGST